MATAGLAAVCVRREAVLVLTPKFQPMIRVTRAVVVYGCTSGLNCATYANRRNAGHVFLRPHHCLSACNTYIYTFTLRALPRPA